MIIGNESKSTKIAQLETEDVTKTESIKISDIHSFFIK